MEESISYVVDTANGDLSQVFVKETEDTVTYYTYGNGLIAQETYTKDNERKKNANRTEKNDVLNITISEYLVYHYNNVGSTVAVTDGKGTITHAYSYTPYGELISGKYGKVDYLYNGQYGVTGDANGLYYMRARYYNIDIKRFINQDILTGSIDSSKSLNRYVYVEGNPISYLDPFGLEPWDTTEMHLAATALGLAASKLPQPLSSCVSAVAAGFDLGLTLYDIFYQLKNHETTSILISIGTIILDITTIVTSIIMIDKVNEMIRSPKVGL